MQPKIIITRGAQENHLIGYLALEIFKFDFSECRLQNLEFGVNITPPIRTTDIHNNLLIHKNKKFKDIDVFGKRGNYRQFRHQRYLVKAYDKFAQYLAKLNLTHPV